MPLWRASSHDDAETRRHVTCELKPAGMKNDRRGFLADIPGRILL